MKTLRYTQAMVDEFVHAGYWTDETFYDSYQRNARVIGDREALVDSKYRVTWREATDLVDAIAAEVGRPELVDCRSAGPGESRTVGDGGRLRNEVGWEPQSSAAEGIARTVNWWLRQTEDGRTP